MGGDSKQILSVVRKGSRYDVVKSVDFGLISIPTSVGSMFGRRFEGYKLISPPSLLYIPICNIFSRNNKSGLFQLCSEIRLNWPNPVNNFLVCFFLFISFIILLCLFNIICRVALLVFCFSGKITRFSQHGLHNINCIWIVGMFFIF